MNSAWSGAATLGAGLALLVTAPSPDRAVHALMSPPATADALAPLLSVVALVAWGLFAWLLVVAAAALLARLPGPLGWLAAHTMRRIAPAGIRRLVEVALGLAIGVGGIGAVPASASGNVPPAPAATTAGLDWPTASPALDWPGSLAASSAAPHPEAPVAARRSLPPRLRNHAASDLQAAVVIRPGDSLWAVAAEHLPAGSSTARIAQAWPRWWSANRAAVGPDPDLIHPGLQLTPPALP